VCLETHWHKGRWSFTVPDIEPLIGHLNHAARTIKWLLHLMSHLYTSLAAAIGSNRQHLMHSCKAFRETMKLIKAEPVTEQDELVSSFAAAETTRQVHKTKRRYILLPTAKDELSIIRRALADPQITKSTPIAHLISHTRLMEPHTLTLV
jgi:hypothetical protein